MNSLLSGPLDRRITIERATVSRDAMNEQVTTWSPLATVWASAAPVRDGERFADGEVRSLITMRFQVRWSSTLSGLDERDRVIFDGRTYDIHGVKEIGRRVGLEISAAARSERT